MDSNTFAGVLGILAGICVICAIWMLRARKPLIVRRPRTRRRFRWRSGSHRKYLILVAVALIGAAWLAQKSSLFRTACDIKGNINFRGEHIYHLPGDAYYEATVVRPERGEQWFCSELQAMFAGWRHARR